MNKIIDCVTFFNESYIFDLRYNILKDHVDEFVICESKYDHKGISKPLRFDIKKYKNPKINYLVLDNKFPEKTNAWQNQAIQREYMLNSLNHVEKDDYIFFSDPDEIINPKILNNFSLKKKYGIFMQKNFNYKFNLFNPHESPWEGSRVAKKKNLKSIDYMRQKIRSKNLKYNFYRFDKDRSIELYQDGGWHFNNIMSAKDISVKLKTFAHTEFSNKEYSSAELIQKKINEKIDLFDRGHKYKTISFDDSFPEFLLKNLEKYKEFICS